MRRENSSSVNIWQKRRLFCTYVLVHLWYYLVELSLKREIFQAKVVDKTKTNYSSWRIFFPRKLSRLCDNVEKYGPAKQITGGNIIGHMRFACWINKAEIQTHSQNIL
jgi:hypothetical protein